MPFLDQLEMNDTIELWHDRRIGIGENWYAEIADRLDKARIAILFITQEFLASRFCKLEEVPVLLQRARSGKLHLLPIIAKPCNWKSEPWLKRLQMWPRDARALIGFEENDRLLTLTEFAEHVEVIPGYISRNTRYPIPPRHPDRHPQPHPHAPDRFAPLRPAK